MTVFYPACRKDLHITPKLNDDGALTYLIRSPESQELYEFGEEEFFLIQQLDGQSSPEFIFEKFHQHFGVSLPLGQLEAFINQLRRLNFLIADPGIPLGSDGAPVTVLSLGNPDRLLISVASWLHWAFSPAFLTLIGFIVILGIGTLITNYDRFYNETRTFWQPKQFFWVTALGVLWVNSLGEFAKAMVCRYFKGQIPEFGMIFIYTIFPHFFFDMSDAFWLLNKSKRLWVLASGLICQLLVFGLASIAWICSAPRGQASSFWVILIVAAIIFSLLNAIPFWERDGYRLLSTWLEIPNLHARGRALFDAWISQETPPEPLSSRQSYWFKWYGFLAILFRFLFWLIFFGMYAYLMIWYWQWRGLGALLLLVLLYLRFADYLKRQIMHVSFLRTLFVDQSGRIKLRTGVKIAMLAAFIIILFLPYPFEAGGDFKLLPNNQLSIRAVVPGEIEFVYFKEGERVTKGQVLAKLLDKDQRAKVIKAREFVAEAAEKLSLLRSGAKPELVAKAEQEVKLAETTLAFSKVEAERYTQMFKEKAITDEDLQQRLKAKDEAGDRVILARKNLQAVKNPFRVEEIRAQEAQLRSAQADLELAEKDLELTILRSPMDGWFINAYPAQKVGQYLEVGDLLGVVEDTKDRIAEIEVPETDIEEVKVGAQVKLKTWAYPTKTFYGRVTSIAPVGYEQARRAVQRVLTEKENRTMPVIPDHNNKVIRVLSATPDGLNLLHTEMTGYAKIEGSWKPVGLAFSRWLVRFFMVTVWSWLP